MYLSLIVAVYRNTKPISQFIGTLREMVPALSARKLKTELV